MFTVDVKQQSNNQTEEPQQNYDIGAVSNRLGIREGGGVLELILQDPNAQVVTKLL